MNMPSILVTRATGTQGLAVCRNLRTNNFDVHGLVPDVSNERTRPLKAIGVTLFPGTEYDRDAIDRAMAGCSGLFMALMPKFDEEASEIRQARILLSAAKAAGVRQIVASTAGALERFESVNAEDYFATKLHVWKLGVEKEVQSSGIDIWTILRPGYFMSNFLWPLGDVMFPELAKEHRFVSAYSPESVLPLIDPNDIGAAAAAAFQAPEKLDEKVIELASEKMTVEQCIEALSSVADVHIQGVHRPREESEALAKVNPIVATQLMSLTFHKHFDLDQLKALNLQMGTFKGYLTREKELVWKTFDPDRKDQIKLF